MDQPVLVSKAVLQQLYRSLKGSHEAIRILESLLYPSSELTSRVERAMRVEVYSSQKRP